MKTVRKAVAVLEKLSEAPEALGVTELAIALDMDKSIVHRLLKTLVDCKLVHQHASTRRYSLGIGFVQLGGRFLHQLGLPEVAHPHLFKFWERCDETVHLCVRSELKTVLLRVYESRQGVRVSANVGDQADLHATSTGKIFLAYETPDLVESAIGAGLIQRQANTITNAAQLREELAQVRRQGFATDIEESDKNYSAIAVPVIGHLGECIAAIAVAMPISRMSAAPDAVLLADLKETSHSITMEVRKASSTDLSVRGR